MQNHNGNGNGVSTQAVKDQMARILESDGFVRSGRMRRFLEFIVAETLAGRAGELGEYAIGVAVFDRGQDFEPAIDPIVRNDARRLRHKLLEYYREQQAEPVLVEIPKGGYVPVFRPHAQVEAMEVRRCDAPRRVAVLPFEVLSPAAEDSIYGRSLCMSLTANLTNVGGVETVAHGYLWQQPIRETVSELRLSHVIHGTLIKLQDRCRVIVNLIQAAGGAQLWAREYDFRSNDMLAAQSDISAQVLREVTTHFGLQQPQPKRLAMAA